MLAVSLAFALAVAGLQTPARGAPSMGQQPGAPEELTDAEVAERVRAYLGAIDTPIPADRWRALGARAVPALESVARGGGLPSRRANALTALSIIGGSRARDVVLRAARSEDESFAVRASALHGAGRLLGPKELSRQLRPVLEGARDPGVRATAADVLARRSAATSCKAVRAQADREDAGARARFAQAIERCGDAAR